MKNLRVKCWWNWHLEGELVKKRRDSVEPAIQKDELRFGLLGALAHSRLIGFVGVQLLLNHLGKLSITLKITEKTKYFN